MTWTSEPHFPEEAVQEAAALALSDELFADRDAAQGVTIDGPSSRDLDNAIHLETGGDHVTVHVSIADVTAGIRPDSALFREAQLRVATQYRPSMNIPMLPRILSEDRFSLLEGCPRPAVTFSTDLSPLLEIEDFRISLTAFTNRRRLDYESVDRILDALPGDPDFRFLSNA